MSVPPHILNKPFNLCPILGRNVGWTRVLIGHQVIATYIFRTLQLGHSDDNHSREGLIFKEVRFNKFGNVLKSIIDVGCYSEAITSRGCNDASSF